MLPDLDVLGFHYGIPYAAEWGHRGFSHSLLLALFVAVVGAGFAKQLVSTPRITFWFLLVTVASHGILDAFTNGGLGIALLWPFSHERFFAPLRPIEVSPLSVSGILSVRGVAVLRSELLWVWLPCLGVAVTAVAFRYHRARTIRSGGRANASARDPGG
jgi:inner membrane protein